MCIHSSVGWLFSRLCLLTHLKSHPRKPEKTLRLRRERGRKRRKKAKKKKCGKNCRRERNEMGGGVEVLCEWGIRVRRLEVEDDIIW